MNCKDLEKYLTDYIFGTLSVDDLKYFENVLENCPKVKNKIKNLKQSINFIKETQVNPFLETKILNQIEQQEKKYGKIALFFEKFEIAIATLLIIIALSLGIFIGINFYPDTSTQTEQNFYTYSDEFYSVENDYLIEIYN